MKKLNVLCLLLALFCAGMPAQATTITIRPSETILPVKPILGGTLVPLLAVDLKASNKQFPPWVYLIVQQKGLSSWDTLRPPALKNIVYGEPDKLVSYVTPVSDEDFFRIGPVFLTKDEWRTVIISGEFLPDLFEAHDRSIGFDVVGISVDSYFTELGDDVDFVGTFPVRSEYFLINGTNSAESLTIRNVTTPTNVVVITGKTSVLARFDFIAERGDVELTMLPLSFELSDGEARAITSVQLKNEQGEALTSATHLIAWDNPKIGYIFIDDTHVIVPRGTNHWYLEGVIDQNLVPEWSTLHVSFDNISEVKGLVTTNWILATIENSLSTILLLNNPQPFTTFDHNLAFGSSGEDVLILQYILNASPDTRIATEGVNSNGQETGYFDELTRQAVMKFQTAHGLPAVGFVGPLTRQVLNNLIAQPRISQVFFTGNAGSSGQRPIGMIGFVKPNTAYAVEVTHDLKIWERCGEIPGRPTVYLKEHVGSVNQTKYADRAFFRLVEMP